MKLAEKMIFPGHGTLTLVNLNGDVGLVVGVSGEGLGLLGGDGGVSLNQGSHDSSSSFNSQGQRSNVKQPKIGSGLVLFTSKDGDLDSGTVGNSLISVDGLVQFLAVEEVRD